MAVAPREHPIHLVVHGDDLRRSRLIVFFRPLLAIPHLAWLVLWSAAAIVAAVGAWAAALVTGQVPLALHGFLAAYVRYATHVLAFLFLVGRRFPGFAGAAGSFDVDVEIGAPDRQRRSTTLLRLFLALPAILIAGLLAGAAFVVASLGWWCALVTGRMPERLLNVGASCLRFGVQTYAYLFLLTDRYPSVSDMP